MSLDDRLRRIENIVAERAAARAAKTSPLFGARVAMQCAMMDASVPSCDDEERNSQLAEVGRLRQELLSLTSEA